ncbi:3-deoxy-7-phosphoheptulonate synthase [Streptomyces sp. SID8352]|uniref:3-deoxy-7-phosphoheptulonate synthase n=1 Tax=Streptomyces sp. SID8352 TaxID=2690338 RepID=UPI00136EDBB0|nr:3-deoxy-7-phosphoheptulonate synthase class II [Streptomyces sp. SID8352]
MPAPVITAQDQLLHDYLAPALALPAAQQPVWPEPLLTRAVRQLLGHAPGLVTVAEIERLRRRLADVAEGRAFVLQGGDCAETFADNTPAHVGANVSALHRTAQTLRRATGLPVTVLARLAGQYAKPRSAQLDGQGLPSYRGDAVNGLAPDARSRLPDAARMLAAYAQASATLNWLGTHSFAPDLFVSHEALLLDYEAPLVRWGPEGNAARPYSLSAHSLWIGERTRQRYGAHLAFAAAVDNPVAVKLGPRATPDEVLRYARTLDPAGVPGRLTFICRMGHDKVTECLPPLIAKLTEARRTVVWQCDPMHANTHVSANGYKTRDLEHVMAELDGYFSVHRALGTHPGGVHLELTGDDVTECVGGTPPVTPDRLPQRYRTACDPRLNPAQTREVARQVGDLLHEAVIRAPGQEDLS